ncbi:TonB family C-terminal domain [Phocoenobacter uteri]|uniref:TonB family C-terminal domain n=1 Tax=Phocoenobacter uteri TaxID=146806 RepID=A0A379CC42_9PAST|nr:energy transducer TonB [Phocoenobacter uteri]MDG6881904.1 hypothetical protein [Phocoenobacter uteri]SUB59942.1 TonB family C-terminal domain [Phocoenobacter uteri]
MPTLFLEQKQSRNKDRFIGLLSVIVVFLFHFLLGVFLFFFQVTTPYQFQQGLNAYESLNMVNIEFVEPIPVKPEPKPIEKVMATEVKTAVADLQKEQPKKKKVEKVEKIKPLNKVEKPHKKEKVKTKVPKKTATKKQANVSKTAHRGSGNQTRQGEVGGAGVGKSTGAGLGAGYGSTLTGQCSDLSDDADDNGSVYLSVRIAANGKANAVSVLKSSGIKRLDRQALKIAQKHRYQPAIRNGQPVEGEVKFKMHFQCGNS